METFNLFFSCLLPLGLIGVLVIGFRKYKELREQRDHLEMDLKNSEVLIDDLRKENAERTSAEWFEEVKTAEYRNEIEVETKFVYQLVKYLGHDDSNVDVRYPINIQVGRNSNRGEADWVIWNGAAGSEDRKALFIIEAKGQYQDITTEVQEQARSYAFALNAPIYLCTNGKRFVIYRRGVERDSCIIDCDAAALADNWSDIRTVLRSKR